MSSLIDLFQSLSTEDKKDQLEVLQKQIKIDSREREYEDEKHKQKQFFENIMRACDLLPYFRSLSFYAHMGEEEHKLMIND